MAEQKYKDTELVEDKDWYKGMIKYMARQRAREKEAAAKRKKLIQDRQRGQQK